MVKSGFKDIEIESSRKLVDILPTLRQKYAVCLLIRPSTDDIHKFDSVMDLPKRKNVI